jgi:hypothetical protein
MDQATCKQLVLCRITVHYVCQYADCMSELLAYTITTWKTPGSGCVAAPGTSSPRHLDAGTG